MADPLLQPFQLEHLTLKNRVISASHEPAYSEEALPKTRYRLYHEEKAKGGVGMTMIGGSSIVALDSPQAFGNLYVGSDAIIPWFKELTAGIHKYGAAVMCQITHLGRRTSWATEHWCRSSRPRRCASRRTAPSRRRWRISTSRGGRGLWRRCPSLPRRRPGRDRDRGLRPSVRCLLVAQHQRARQRYGPQTRKPPALLVRGFARDPPPGRQRLHRRPAHGGGRDDRERPHPQRRDGDRQAHGGERPGRFHQRDPGLYRHRRGVVACHSRHGYAGRPASRPRARGEAHREAAGDAGRTRQ